MKRNKRRGLIRASVLVGVLVVVAGGCGDDNGDVAKSEKRSSAANEVVMKLVAFKPGELDVKAGTTVTWRNGDPGAHTVTAGTVEQGSSGVTQKPNGKFDSGQVANGKTFEQTFDQPGTYSYFCAMHPATMRGEIRVS